MTTPPTSLPQSDALREASALSLPELFSSDPARLTRPDFEAMIAALRAQAIRNAQAEAAGTRLGKGTANAGATRLPVKSTERAEDLL